MKFELIPKQGRSCPALRLHAGVGLELFQMRSKGYRWIRSFAHNGIEFIALKSERNEHMVESVQTSRDPFGQ
ncbi:MAG TPA: hypothetical protein DCS88_11945 [Alphaproteobacteria bacterium]|nr:hypothetical protein [Alphaproteobacteria bacterium]